MENASLWWRILVMSIASIPWLENGICINFWFSSWRSSDIMLDNLYLSNKGRNLLPRVWNLQDLSEWWIVEKKDLLWCNEHLLLTRWKWYMIRWFLLLPNYMFMLKWWLFKKLIFWGHIHSLIPLYLCLNERIFHICLFHWFLFFFVERKTPLPSKLGLYYVL